MREAAFKGEFVSRPVAFIQELNDAERDGADGLHGIFTPL